MNKYKIILYVILIIKVITQSGFVYSQSNIDSDFVKWNKATFESLEKQKLLAINHKQKDLIENRIKTIKSYWEISCLEEINKKSIRYDFLKTVFLKYKNQYKNVAIIERNESGYVTTLKNFVLYSDSANVVNVDCYIFSESKWNFIFKCDIQNNFFQDKLSDYVTEFWKGSNSNDVIITKFQDAQLTESKFYLLYTLLNKFFIKDIPCIAVR